MTTKKPSDARFAMCIRNSGYSASLEVRKVYKLIADKDAERHNRVRIVDESGEDYLYPAEFFVPISLPEAAELAFGAAS